MWVEWPWTPIPLPWTPWMGRRFIDSRLWFLIEKKTLHWWRHMSRPLKSVSSNLHSNIAFSWKFVLFPIQITLLWDDIYMHTIYALNVLVLFIRLYYKFTYLKTPQLPQRLEPASFCSAAQCAIHYTKRPGSSPWYFWLYTSIFINFDFELIIK